MTDEKPVEVKKPTPEEFANKFKALCDEMGYQLVATPQWISRDDGTFSMRITWSVGKLPKQTNIIDKQALVS